MTSLQPTNLGSAADAITQDQLYTGADTKDGVKTGNTDLHSPDTVKESWDNQPDYRKSIFYVQTSATGYTYKSIGRPPSPEAREISHGDIIRDYVKEVSKLSEGGMSLRDQFEQAQQTINQDKNPLVYLKFLKEEEDQTVFAEVGVSDHRNDTVLKGLMAIKHPRKSLSLRTSHADKDGVFDYDD